MDPADLLDMGRMIWAPSSTEKEIVRDAEAFSAVEGNIRSTDMARWAGGPRGRRTQARPYALHRDLGDLFITRANVAGRDGKGRGARSRRWTMRRDQTRS